MNHELKLDLKKPTTACRRTALRADYLERPAYQQNDYIARIERAKMQKTEERRLDEMLDELKTGGVYMKIKHVPSTKKP